VGVSAPGPPKAPVQLLFNLARQGIELSPNRKVRD
jgi:hypothetical protein